jgi:hypothetical protein
MMRGVMRRVAFVAATVVAAASVVALVLGPAGPVLAAADDDIPGVPLGIGTTISQAVGSGDPSDVYAVDLVEGQEVHFRCDPGTTSGPSGSFHLLAPGASSVADPGEYDEIAYTLSGGNPTRSWADFDYVPARSGTYYLWIEWEAGALNYTLSAIRTSRAALALAPDTDDVPGLSVGSGTLTGVVSTLADPDDVYAVALTAGKPVTIQLIPLTPYGNGSPALASLYLLDPATPSLADRYGHVLEGMLLAAKNSKDAASRQTAEIQYTPTESGTYYVWVEAGGVLYGQDFGNFAYQLSITGNDEPPAPPVLSDVDGSPYATAIYEMARRSIISGFTDHTFRPDQQVSRQQFAKMIVKTVGLTVTGAEQCPFSDVVAGLYDDPFYPVKYVAVCAAAHITEGTTATTFDPSGNITRQQLIKMVVSAAGLPDPPTDYTPPFQAGQLLPVHFPYARKAAYAGLLEGLRGMGASYDFFASSSRGECAQLLYNLLGR